MNRQCFLRCLLDSHKPILLQNNIENLIGRSKVTKIKDQTCSRRQISLKPNNELHKIEVKQIGVNPSGIDGFALKKDTVYNVDHGTKIEILLNQYFHVLEFDPPPEVDIPETKTLVGKRKLEDMDSLPKNKKNKNELGFSSPITLKETIENLWEEIDNGELYIFTSKGVKSSCKVASFDMDGTLIKTKSGKVYPVDTSDWQLAFTSVIKKMKELKEQGYKIVIFTNQAPIGKGRVKIEDFKKKMELIVQKLEVPVQSFIATGKSFYRKPATGMWNTLQEQKNDGVVIDKFESFYCGDAAGRVANWAPGKKKDHSMADRLLAENLCLKFYTPEEFFLGHSVANIPISKPEFVPHEIISKSFNESLISPEQEILVLVGYPGSGKSFLAKQIENKSGRQYVAVCRDVLGTWQKCAAEATKLIQKGKSVIVDSTNPDVESRSRWTSLANDLKVLCRCANLKTNKAHAQHNNKYRELMKMNHLPVNDIVFHSYKNKYVEPKTSEGFKEVINVDFNPCFDNEEAEKIYKMYLLEK